MDYRSTNESIVYDPIPRTRDSLNVLAGTVTLKPPIFQRLLAGREIHKKDKQKTSLRTRTVMSFWFCNAFATFKRLMEQVLNVIPWEAPLICPDDTISHAKSFSDKLRLRCCFQEAPSSRTKTESKKVPLVSEACYLP